MNKYIVSVREICISKIEVEAFDEDHAIEKATQCDGNWITNREFETCAPTDTWTIEFINAIIEPDPLDREAYTLAKISQVKNYLDKMEKENNSLVEVVRRGLEELEEELSVIKKYEE